MPLKKPSKTRKTPVDIAQAAIIFVALNGVFLSACSKPEPLPAPIRSVKVITVGAQGLVAGSEYAAEVRARVESRLGFRVAGKITKRFAELGQRVQAGQMLAQIDPQDYKLAADAARAQVAAALTNRDLAAADFKRFVALKDQNFISGAELERREAVLKAAQAQLEQAQAQLSAQGNQAKYTSLVADVSGVVTAVEAEVGQVVSAGAPVVRIAQDGPRDVVFNVPEDKLASVPIGAPVGIKLWALSSAAQGAPASEPLKGRVRELAASADPVTRTFPVKVTVDAADAGRVPALGSTVNVVPPAGLAGVQVIKLPTSALFQQGQQSQVWVLDKASMTVKATVVQVATADGNEAVIAGGIWPGDMVVSAGVHVLSPGQKVVIFQEKTAAALINNAQAATKNVAVSESMSGSSTQTSSPPSSSAAAK